MISPPLLVSPLVALTDSEREEFTGEVKDISKATDGSVISIPFPIAMHHRIDGIWLPVSDLGSFHAPPDPKAKPEPEESSYVPDEFA
jgi:hypothetical protein